MNKWTFIILLGALIIARFFFLEETLLGPHVWRQSDTANYAWDFYKNGIDLLHPSVCWMGGHKTVILEFPLVEAVIAAGYHLFGSVQIVAKLICFGFFLGSCYFFFRLVQWFTNTEIARLSTVVYAAIPLSFFYSIAIHIDFAEMCFTFAMAFFWARGIQRESTGDIIWGMIWGTLAFLTKAPYALLFFFPLLGLIIKEKKYQFVLRHAVMLLLPIGFFLAWQQHVNLVNDAAPDWDFIPGYRKFTYNAGWYFGPLEQRMDPTNWLTIKDRLLYEILGISGGAFALVGLIFSRKRLFLMLWLLGGVVYVLIFFNLNVIHNYYQLPFVPILSIFIAIGIYESLAQVRSKNQLIIILLTIVFIGESMLYAHKNYFKPQPLREAIGRVIQKETEENDLVLINHKHLDSKFPNYLYESRRNGWQIPDWGLNASLIYRLMEEGCDYVALVRNVPVEGELHNALQAYPMRVIGLVNGEKLYLYETRFSHIWSIMPEEEKKRLKEKLGDEVR